MHKMLARVRFREIYPVYEIVLQIPANLLTPILVPFSVAYSHHKSRLYSLRFNPSLPAILDILEDELLADRMSLPGGRLRKASRRWLGASLA